MKIGMNLKAAFLLTLMIFSLESFAAEPYLKKQFQVSSNAMLDVETSGASVSITGGNGNEIEVEMYVKLNGEEMNPGNAEVERLLENYNITIDQSGNTVSVKVKSNNNSNWKRGERLQLSFKIMAPTEISSEFKSSGGSISIYGVQGSQTVATSGGSIRIAESGGKVSTRSSGGSFSLEEFMGDVDVETSGGAVKIDGMTGMLSVRTSGGSVSIDDISGGINASTSGGSIRASLLRVDQDLNFRSSGGSITARIPEGLGLDLNLRGGRVNTKLPNFSGEIKRDLIVGKLNGGGSVLNMESSGGSINLEFFN